MCLQPTAPGLNPLSVVTDYLRLGAVAAQQLALYPHVAEEPALVPYARLSA